MAADVSPVASSPRSGVQPRRPLPALSPRRPPHAGCLPPLTSGELQTRPWRRARGRPPVRLQAGLLPQDFSGSAGADDADAAPSRRVACRRLAALGLLEGALLLSEAFPANAMRDVMTPDGDVVSAYELDITLRIVALRGSLPQDAVAEFRRLLGKHGRCAIEQRAQLGDIFKELSLPEKKKSAARADAVTLGDAWLAPAIRGGLLQPIPGAEASAWWAALPARWKALVRRDAAGRPSSRGAVWAAPYGWGCTLIAVRRDKLQRANGAPVRDWAGLLQPALRGRVAWVDAPRELAGAALRTLGLSMNASLADMAARCITLEQLAAAVQQLRQQVRVVSSRDHVRALAAGDTWAAVGWSGDLLPLAQRTSNIALVAPASGTALWANLWAAPAGAQGGSQGRGPSPLLPAWLAHGLQPARSLQSASIARGASPLLLPEGKQQGGRDARHDGAAAVQDTQQLGRHWGMADMNMPAPNVLQRSEFLLPLHPDILEACKAGMA